MMGLVGVLWGLHCILLKIGFGLGLTFPQIAIGEYLAGSLVFGAIVLGRKTSWPNEDRWFWRMMMAGGVVGAGVTLFLFWSYQLGPVAIGATLLFLYVPFTQLINILITRRFPPVGEILSMGMVLTGAVIAADFWGVANQTALKGAPQAVWAALCFALFFVLTSRLEGRSTPMFRSFFFATVSGLVALLVSGVVHWSLLTPALHEPKVILWLGVMGVCGQAIPIFLLVRYGPRTGSGLGSILTAGELPVAVILSVIVLGDVLRSRQVEGVVLVLIGIMLPHLPLKKWMLPLK